MKKALLAAAAGAFALLLVSGAAATSTVVVRPSALDGWTLAPTANDFNSPAPPSCDTSVSLVNGPANPPLGSGSAELATGNGTTGGDCVAELRRSDMAGTKLSDLTTLTYWTYVVENNGQQAPYLTLWINTSGDASGNADSYLFFEPPYQTPTSGNPSLPNQGAVQYDTWQSWDALEGGWWASGAGGSICSPGAPSSSGPGVCALSTYLAAYPNAVIVNDATYGDGFNINAGGASPASGPFESNVDDVTIGVSGNSTTYDFEAGLPTATSKAQCKKGGWQNYADANGNRFKNQGDCVSYVATGGKNGGNG